jgi:hypothetical protein
MEDPKKDQPVLDEDDFRRVRESNRQELETTIPKLLKVLIEGLDTCRTLMEEWHYLLLGKIAISIGRVCQDLLNTSEWDALPGAAWNARNLLELWVWTKYCCASRVTARRFHEDCLRDSQGLTDSYFKMCDVVGLDRGLEPRMREQIQAVACDQLGIESLDAGYERVAKAAATVGLDNWYLPCNAFLSKFAHPTAFLVVGVMHQQDESLREFQAALTTQGVFFAHQCVTALADFVLMTPSEPARGAGA